MSVARALRAGTSVAPELLRRPGIGPLGAGQRADIVAMPGDPFAGASVATNVDVVMQDGAIYRHRDFDPLKLTA